MTNRELNEAVAKAIGTVRKDWVIGEPDESISAQFYDGYNPFQSRQHAQKYLDKERARFDGGSMWDDWEVWENETYPFYAQNIEVAWKLVEIMGGQTCMRLTVESSLKNEGRTEYRVNSDCGIVRGSRNYSSTMPRAICKAYLQWHAKKSQNTPLSEGTNG